MEIKEIIAALEDTKGKFLQDAKAFTDISVKEAIATIEAKIANIKGLPDDFDATQLKQDVADTLKGFNELQAKLAKSASSQPKEVKTFGQLLMENVEKDMDNIERALKERKSFNINLKAVGNMTLGVNLTGDSMATYNQRQAILPAQAINFRDLIPTTQSPTGLYVTYKETGGEGSISTQTEGASKTQIDYDLQEVKTVNQYIAGFARFSKQMMKSLPFFEGTLSRMLLRDFYKAENASFFTTVSAAATGVTTVVSTEDIEELIELIANQKTANFTPSYALVSNAQMARLVIRTYNKGYYAGAGAVQIVGQGLTIWGVPVIAASWVADDKVLIIDSNFLERVEVEGLNIAFSMDDADNFTKNLVTARIECYEAVNLMLPQSAIYADFGNVV